MKKLYFVLLWGAFLLNMPELSGQDEGSLPLESITEAEMRDHIYFLASDFMAGRAGPSAEYELAAQYAATQFASGGLQALVSENGNMNGFFQEVPYTKVVLDQEATWVLHTKEGRTSTAGFHSSAIQFYDGTSEKSHAHYQAKTCRCDPGHG